MSDCCMGGRRFYNVPTHTPAEDRLEITVHFDGEYNPHPIVLNRLDREVDYVKVDGERYERVRECRAIAVYNMHDEWFCDKCSACDYEWYEDEPNYCPHCGAKVVDEC